MSKRSNRANIIELGGEPRINFLPVEIQDRKDARRRRRSLFMLVILVGILCGIGYVYAAQYATDRQAALASEQQTTLDLITQQGQFIEARKLADKVKLTAAAITHSTLNEVFWREVVKDLDQALPTGARLHQWSIKGLNALQIPEEADTLFSVTGVAEIQLDVFTNNLATLTATLNSLGARPGVLVMGIGSTQLLDDGSGYGTIIVVQFNEDVLAGRFAGGWMPGITPAPSEPATPAVEEPADESADDDTDESGEGQ